MYDRHWRMTLGIAIGGSGAAGVEMAQINVSLAKDSSDNEADMGMFLQPNDAVWDDLAQDCRDFWSDTRTRMTSICRLHTVKFADIGPDGKYLSAPVIRDFTPVPGPHPNIGFPWQTACAVTLMTDAQLSRVKGRFYLPIPYVQVDNSGRFAESERDQIEASCADFLSNVANQPGIDVLDIGPVVASQGRQSPPAGPANYGVTHVRVGRVLDTIRSRRSHLDETYGTPTALNL